MSVLPKIGARATSIVTLSSFVGALLPQKVASKKLSEVSTDEPIEFTKPKIPIYANTQCFINKNKEVTSRKIYNTFI